MNLAQKQQTRAKVHTVEVVEVDTDPVIAFYDRPWQWNPEYKQLPEPFKAALRDVIHNPDARKCAHCDHPVGYVTVETELGERRRWSWVSLARVPTRYFPEAGVEEGSPVVLLCEDCTPVIPDGRGKA
jgi:hypothetical protein